jgi:hypothetical protein
MAWFLGAVVRAGWMARFPGMSMTWRQSGGAGDVDSVALKKAWEILAT